MSLLPKLPAEQQLSCENCSSQRHAWFEKCNQQQLKSFQLYRNAQCFIEAGNYLFMEGETPRAAYTLQDGWAICFKSLANGRRQILSVAFSGDYLGYRTDMSVPVDYSVMAMSTCRICTFSEKNIRQLLLKSPLLIENLIHIQEKQAAACRTRLTYIGQASAKQKIAFFLINILEKLERRGMDISQDIDFPLTHEDVADAIGITSVHMCRVAVELRKAGIVDCRHNHIQVLDFEKLSRLARVVF